jgi:hypothetical protein
MKETKQKALPFLCRLSSITPSAEKADLID